MAENELLDIPNHASWRPLRRLVAENAGAAEIANESLDRLESKLRKLRPAIVRAIIEAVQAGDDARLGALVRECDGVESEFARLVRTECRYAANATAAETLAAAVAVLQRCWLDKLTCLLDDASPASDIEKQRIRRHLKARLDEVASQWAAALLPRQSSLRFPKSRRVPRSRIGLATSLLDKTIPPVRGRVDESASRNR